MFNWLTDSLCRVFTSPTEQLVAQSLKLEPALDELIVMICSFPLEGTRTTVLWKRIDLACEVHCVDEDLMKQYTHRRARAELSLDTFRRLMQEVQKLPEARRSENERILKDGATYQLGWYYRGSTHAMMLRTPVKGSVYASTLALLQQNTPSQGNKRDGDGLVGRE
jgi:hypothetical protein